MATATPTTNVSGITRDQLIDNTVEGYAERIGKIINRVNQHPDEEPLGPILSAAHYRHVLGQIISKRMRHERWTVLASPPTFRERPLGSLFLRLKNWHGSGGVLDGYMIAKWDASTLHHAAEANADWIDDATREIVLSFPTGDDLFSAIDTTVMIVAGGSSAVEAWRRMGMFR